MSTRRFLHTPTARSARAFAALLLALLLLTMAPTLLPLAATGQSFSGVSGNPQSLLGAANAPTCANDDAHCNGSSGGAASGSPQAPDAGTPVATPPPCAIECARIQWTYHDPRTQTLLALLSQTPTGQGCLTYLLFMGARLGDSVISWHDLSDAGGTTNDGGFIQLNSKLWTRQSYGPTFLAGTLTHECVESYYDVAEGIRQMATSHADYVAEWLNGRFERELHAIPAYAQDPSYFPSDYSSYGLTYSAWLNGTDDGRMYQDYRANCNLHAVDRKGHAWPPSDTWAEWGIWGLGQGTDVAPLPNSMRLSPALLTATDLAGF